MRTAPVRVPDTLPVLAILAAGLAQLVPSHFVAGRVDALLAMLVLVTALDIDPRQLLAVHARWRMILLLTLVPMLVLGVGAWALGALVHGTTRDGLLALGLAPTEVAAVGLIGLMDGPAELAIAVLAVSLLLSATLAPPLLSTLATGSHTAPVFPLLERFLLIVGAPLLLGLAVRGTAPGIARGEAQLSAAGSLIVALLIYASLSGSGDGHLASAAVLSLAFLTLSLLLALCVMRALAGRIHPSLALAVGMRDFAVAAALAAGAFGSGAAHVAAIYGVLMLTAGATITGITRHVRARAMAA